LLHRNCVYVTKELCLLHRNCVFYTGTVFMSQRNCVCYTGTVFIHVRIKLLVMLLGPLILFWEQRQFILYVVTYSAISLCH